MIRRTPSNLSDYLALARRRIGWILLPALLIAGGTAWLVQQLPRVYKSQSLIMIEPQKVPPALVPSIINMTVAQQVQSISERILSRTQLRKIIRKYDLYRYHPGETVRETLVQRMRKDIKASPVADPNNPHTIVALKLSYEGPDPRLVRRVANDLTLLFINENLKQRQAQASGTSSFINSELAQAQQQLSDEQNQLSVLQAHFMGSLPQQQQANLQILANLQTELQENADSIGRVQQQQAYLRALRSSFRPELAAAKTSPLAAELNQKRAGLIVAEQQDRPDNPDLIRLRREVLALETALKKSAALKLNPANAAKPAAVPAQIAQIDAQEVSLRHELSRDQQARKDIKARILQLQSRLELMPAVEAKLAAVQRNYDISKANFESLLKKKNSASMATAMEEQAEGEEYRVIDPANLPQVPVKPQILKLDLAGIVGGLIFGLLIGYMRDMQDKSMRSEEDISACLNVQPLASIPHVTTARELLQRRRRRWLMGSSVVASLMFLAAGLFLYLHAGGFIPKF